MAGAVASAQARVPLGGLVDLGCMPAERPRAAFFQIFNATSVALVFWICFTLVLTALLKMLPLMSGTDWIVMLAYLTRQHLASGLAELLMIALGVACLPQRMGRGARWLAMTALLAAGAALSAALRASMSRYAPMTPREHWTWLSEVVLLWTALGLMTWALVGAIQRQVLARRRLGQQLAERNLLAAAATEARLTVLQAQIEPHFLFNTLANVRRLCEVDSEQGRQMLGSLLDYLRAALPAMRRSSTALAEEFDLVRAYLTVLQLRMGERLRFRIVLPPDLSRILIPPLILPTLVENSIRHGLAPLREGGTISVGATERDGQVVITVADDGAGFQAAGGSGVGLANTRARLMAQFGGAASLELRGNTPRGVIAEVRLPAFAVERR
jgi:signal transduction histidine kinase